jgi:hypothetical protein
MKIIQLIKVKFGLICMLRQMVLFYFLTIKILRFEPKKFKLQFSKNFECYIACVQLPTISIILLIYEWIRAKIPLAKTPTDSQVAIIQAKLQGSIANLHTVSFDWCSDAVVFLATRVTC